MDPVVIAVIVGYVWGFGTCLFLLWWKRML